MGFICNFWNSFFNNFKNAISKINNIISTESLKSKDNNNNSISKKEDDEQDTKDESHPQITNSKEQEILDKKIIELVPGEPILNDVQKRLFILLIL